MANGDDQYDPYIPAGGAPARGQQGGARRPEDIQSVSLHDIVDDSEIVWAN